MKKSKRLESLQIVRAIAFIAIFLSHVEIFSSGMFGVSVFLILSGFCMTYAYFNKAEYTEKIGVHSNLVFAVNRVKKLYPLHILTLLAVASTVILHLYKHNFPQPETGTSVFYFIMNAGLLQSLIPNRDGYFSYNAVSWYLSMSMICYFFFPWILKKLKNSNEKKIVRFTVVTLIIQVVIAVILQILHNSFDVGNDILKWVTYICPFYRIGDVILGSVLGWFFLNRDSKFTAEKNILKYRAIKFLLFILLAVQIFIYENCNIPRGFMFDLYWLPLSLCFVYVYSADKRSITMKAKRILVYIGDISGYAFLIHHIIIKGIGAFIHNKLILFIAAFIVTVICTEVYIRVVRYIEKNLIKIKNWN